MLEAVEVAEQRRRPGAGPAGRVRGDRQNRRRQARHLEPGEVGLAEEAGAGEAWPVEGGEVVAEDAGPDEGLDVEVDDLAGPVELERRRRRRGQPASAWSGGTSSTHVFPGASCTSAP